MATFPVLTSVTYIGRQYLARSLVGDVAFKITAFSVDDMGGTISGPIPPDLTLITCPTGGGGLAYSGSVGTPSFTTTNCISFPCQIPLAEIGSASNICLVGQVTSPTVEAGTTFLFALGNFAQRTKINTEVWDLTVTIKF